MYLKKLQFAFSFIISILFTALETTSWAHHLPYHDEYSYLLEIDHEIQNRWQKIEQIKSYFNPYTKKTKEEIINEFQFLDSFRKYLWYSNPGQSKPRSNKDYQIASHLLNRTFFPRSLHLIAFKYNCIGNSYNASTILLYGLRFIALEEPNLTTLFNFFKILLSQNVSILVRLKPPEEYADHGSLIYWKDRIIDGPDYSLIQLNPFAQEEDRISIPYFYINVWKDNKGVEIPTLYDLVQKVKTAYTDSEKKTPIACHCAAGVGRTGTFIAAFIIANLLDYLEPQQISIEEIVLKLSIQRSRMVTTVEQYLTLYQFADYYLAMKNNS